MSHDVQRQIPAVAGVTKMYCNVLQLTPAGAAQKGDVQPGVMQYAKKDMYNQKLYSKEHRI